MTIAAARRERLLVIDDDPGLAEVIELLLEREGYAVQHASTMKHGVELAGTGEFELVVTDLKLPDGTGIDVLRELQRQAPGTPVVVISGRGSVAEAVEAMKVGATDFLEKPVSRDRLFRVLDRIFRPPIPGGETEPETVADGSRLGMVGGSEAMRRIYQLVEMASPTRCRVLISGESGTGKELIARAIHSLSPRRERPFVETNCAAIPSELIESEMLAT